MPSDRDIFFQGFTDTQRQNFLTLGISEQYGPQEVILKESELGSEMLLVEEGIISVWVKGARVNEIGPECILGVSSLLEPHPRTARLVSETKAHVLHFKRARVLKHLETASPKLFHTFFVNAFHIHMNLIRQCEERIVQLSLELNEL